jgi:hypothetical protein
MVLDGDSTGVHAEAASDIGIQDGGITVSDRAPNGSASRCGRRSPRWTG